MVVQATWPGATIEDTLDQVTERIEKELQQLDGLDYVRSYTTPGSTTVFVQLPRHAEEGRVQPAFYQVRKRIGDIQGQFPQGVQGPFFNDEFGDVFGNIYAFTADGLTQRQLRDYVETRPHRGLQGARHRQDPAARRAGRDDLPRLLDPQARRARHRLPGADQDAAGAERDLALRRDPGRARARLACGSAGSSPRRTRLQDVNLRVNDRFFRLSDVAEISRGYEDPPAPLFRFNGKPAIGLAIAMRPGANLLHFGEALKERMRRIEASCRSASASTSSPTSPRSSRRRSAASPRRWSRPW